MNLARRVAPGAEDIGASFRQMAQDGFSELGASRIAGAQEQDAEASVRHNVVHSVCRGGELRVYVRRSSSGFNRHEQSVRVAADVCSQAEP
jgi:hypothetical protein